MTTTALPRPLPGEHETRRSPSVRVVAPGALAAPLDTSRERPYRLRCNPPRAAGSCAMGISSDSVIAPNLTVDGIEGLRVVDASVISTVVSVNTNTAAIVIAKKGADLIPGRDGHHERGSRVLPAARGAHFLMLPDVRFRRSVWTVFRTGGSQRNAHIGRRCTPVRQRSGLRGRRRRTPAPAVACRSPPACAPPASDPNTPEPRSMRTGQRSANSRLRSRC
ncbi:MULTISPECIES: GMC oxidoreductase [unclassified Streptomyces]|uniref:GMC oxidoreductase n=1 Tax=unclassified Streptomyces TaxID=2593676 RepID=UPI002E817B83|nr:GMC oxidoreductase [Streptomyces sp. NBC_00589]WUB32989.1 GMC oxidoreductase [Streptomyces sp. NBC_00589]